MIAVLHCLLNCNLILGDDAGYNATVLSSLTKLFGYVVCDASELLISGRS